MTTAEAGRAGASRTARARRESRDLPRASLADTAAVFSLVMGPTIAKGAIIRRRAAVAAAGALGCDLRALRSAQRMRRKYGRGPLLLRTPLQPQALVLDPEHVRRVLDCTPEPFSPATRLKRAALAHFEPHAALVSTGADRDERRRLNEEALQSGCPFHTFARQFVGAANRAAESLINAIPKQGVLSWDHFAEHWFRMSNEVIFGPSAREDLQLREVIDDLRARANWAFLARKRADKRKYLFASVQGYLQLAEPGSLAAMLAHAPKSGRAAPEQQVPQWLFAFDAAAIATFRGLALVTSHREALEQARDEARGMDAASDRLPMVRAATLEALRLWPTTPLILRKAMQEIEFDGRTLPSSTQLIIFAPYFHRDDTRLAYAHRFAPEIWDDDDGPRDWPIIPFSRGPAICPGREIVLLLSSAFNAAMLRERSWRLVHTHRLDADRPLPLSLNHFSLRFEVC